MMTHRERQLAAIRHQATDRVPVDAIAVENAPAIAAELGIPVDAVLERLGMDGRGIGLVYRPQRTDPEATPWGVGNVGDYGTAHQYPLASATTTAQIRNYPWPDPADYDYDLPAQWAARHHVQYAVRGPYWEPLFCRVCSLVGMEQTLVWMLAEPRLFEAALDAVFTRTYECCRHFLQATGDDLDIFSLGDDFASQRGMLFDPRLWRKYLMPRYRRLFALAKAHGKFVWFHSCGDVTAVLSDLIDIGVDVWETVQLHTLPIGARELKREYGRHLAFFGGVSTQRLPFATPAEVVEEVKRCVGELGENGGYICGPDHHVKPDVSVANTLALFDTATRRAEPSAPAPAGT